MAEALLSMRLGNTGTCVESAGLAALVGEPADPTAVALLRDRGVDLSRHRARQLTASMVLGSDLVLAMDEGHRRRILELCPAARGRVRLLGHAGGFEVPDPYGRPRPAFEEALWLVERGLDDLERLLPARDRRKAIA